MVTASGDLVMLAVLRGEDRLGETVLAAGDTLLLRGTWAGARRAARRPARARRRSPRRRAPPGGADRRRAKPSIAVLAVMVVLLATDAVPAAVAGLLRGVRDGAARRPHRRAGPRGISWTTVVLVAGMIPLSTAMRVRARPSTLAERLVDVVGDAGPYALLIGLFVLTAVLGQLISNMATALIVIPVALSAAAEMDVSAQPVLMSVTVAARRVLPDPGGDAGEPDGDGTGRLPLRRLLEARAADARSGSSSSPSCSSRSSGRSDPRASSFTTSGCASRRPRVHGARV